MLRRLRHASMISSGSGVRIPVNSAPRRRSRGEAQIYSVPGFAMWF